MKAVLIVAMSAALAACSGNGTQAGGGAGADSAVAEVKTIADVPAAQGRTDSEEAAVDDVENFATFFDKFKSDSAFQKERTRYPLKVMFSDPYKYDFEKMYYEVNCLSHSDMGFWNLKEYEDSSGYRHFAYRADEDETVVTEYLEDTGVWASYTFRAVDGKWHLVVRTDESM